MSYQSNTIESADGLAKRVHGKVQKILPDKNLKFTNRVKFDKERGGGSEYTELVWLTREQGYTAGGTSGMRRNLNEPKAARSKLAKLTPASVHGRHEVVIELLAQAERQGEKAFESIITAMLRNAKSSMEMRQEVKHLYGGSPVATVTSATDAGTTSVLTITLGSWAPHVWLGSKDMELDAYDGSTLLNTNAALEVSSVGMSITAPTITVTGNAADIDAIVAAGADTDLYFRGYYGLDGTGLRTICGLTSSSGSYLDISCSDFADVWNATQVTWDHTTTEFTWDLLNQGMEAAVNRGAQGDFIAQVPFNVWRQLCGSLDALRALDSSYSASKQVGGHELTALSYHVVSGGTVTIEPSGFQKYGEVMVYPDPSNDGDGFARIGTSAPTFEVPGVNDRLIQKVHGTNAVEYGMFACDGLWLPAPRNCVLFANV